jgi:drug/metabolite transporter (DMT)-like permease
MLIFMQKKHTLLFLLVLGTGFWGISFSITKQGIEHSSPSLFLFYRFLLATAVLTLVFWKHVKGVSRSAVISGAILAVPLVAGISLQTLGIKYSGASQTAFLAATTVVIIPIFKLLFYRTTAPFKIWMAAVLALTGVFIMSVNCGFAISIGDLFTIAGAGAFAVYMIRIERQSAIQNLLPTIVPMFATCALLTLVLALTEKQTSWIPNDHAFWIGAVYCALFSTAFMYTISNIAQRYISAERVSVIYLFEPVFGAIAAYFILGEVLTWRLLLGGTLIFAASLISELDLLKYRLQKT